MNPVPVFFLVFAVMVAAVALVVIVMLSLGAALKSTVVQRLATAGGRTATNGAHERL